MPPVTETSPALPAAPPPADLAARDLLVPVQGVARQALQDTFTDSRSQGRVHDAIDILAPRNTPVLAVESGRIAKLFTSAGVVALTAFISPYRADRNAVRALLEPGEFIEIFVDTPLEVCEARDPKGLYKKARAGQLKGFTGIDDPYEAPEKPELVLDGGKKSIDELADEVLAFLTARGTLSL